MSGPSASVDASEIDRFDRIGEDWWSLNGPMRALHRLNPMRVAWIRRVAGEHFARSGGLGGLRALDIGCGGGLLAESLARLGATVVAIDPAPGNIAVARRHAAQSRLAIDYRATTAEALAAAGETYDLVCMLEVVEHVIDPRAFVAGACALCRPGGLVIAATLNRTLKSFGLAILGAEYVLRWVPKGTHQWEKFVTPDELEEAFEAGGAAVVAQTGVVYTPILDVWRPSRDAAVNYMMAAARDR